MSNDKLKKKTSRRFITEPQKNMYQLIACLMKDSLRCQTMKENDICRSRANRTKTNRSRAEKLWTFLASDVHIYINAIRFNINWIVFFLLYYLFVIFICMNVEKKHTFPTTSPARCGHRRTDEWTAAMDFNNNILLKPLWLYQIMYTQTIWKLSPSHWIPNGFVVDDVLISFRLGFSPRTPTNLLRRQNIHTHTHKQVKLVKRFFIWLELKNTKLCLQQYDIATVAWMKTSGEVNSKRNSILKTCTQLFTFPMFECQLSIC